MRLLDFCAKLSPALCAGLGAACGYYLLYPLFYSGRAGLLALAALAFAPLLARGFFLALASLPADESRGGDIRALRALSRLLAALAAGIALGIGAGAQVSRDASFGLLPESITGVSGVVLDDPRILLSGSAMTTISLKNVHGPGGLRASSSGEITIFFREENAASLREFGRGAEVFADGRLQESSGFGAAYVFSAGSLHLVEPAPPLDRFRTGIRAGLTERFARDEAWGGLALALLLGIRDSLDSGLTDLYRAAGISYILALSGMHLAVIIALISFLLKKPLGLRPAAIVGAAVIVAYCFVVGPLPSLYRSALMYLLGALAVIGMLKRDSLSILSMAFLIQIAASPQAGISLSFILSYLAMLGILVLGKSLNDSLRGVIPPFLLGPLALSIGAFIGTAAVVSHVFGDVRPAGILAGIVIAPLTTAFMVGSILWLCVDALIPALSAALAWPLAQLYDIMEGVARIAGHIPRLSLGPGAAISTSLALSALIVWLGLRLKARRDRLAPFANALGAGEPQD